MPQLDFFAAREDQLALLAFLFDEDIRVLEHNSRPDHEVREFTSPEQVDEAHNGLGKNPDSCLLALWAPTAVPSISFRRIDFDPKHVKNAKFRYEPESGGLMQLYLGGVRERTLCKTEFGHFSEKGAIKWGVQQGVNWTELMQVSRRIQHHIRRHMSVGKFPGRPILTYAAELLKSGYLFKEHFRSEHHWEASGPVRDA